MQMTSTLTILADSIAGKHFEITLEKTADDTAQIRLETWHSNKDYKRDAASTDDVVALFDIRYDKRRRMVFKADLMGSCPTVTCSFIDAGAETPPIVQVVIGGTFAGFGDGTKDYKLDKSSYDELKAFILAAGFPVPN
jgi:hypothetical protein